MFQQTLSAPFQMPGAVHVEVLNSTLALVGAVASVDSNSTIAIFFILSLLYLYTQFCVGVTTFKS